MQNIWRSKRSTCLIDMHFGNTVKTEKEKNDNVLTVH
jgi:hypothetical protein